MGMCERLGRREGGGRERKAGKNSLKVKKRKKKRKKRIEYGKQEGKSA